MTTHDEFTVDLTIYAMGALEGEALAALREHLETCAACREELQRLHNDMAILALTASGPVPPARARQRLMSAIASQPRLREVPRPVSVWAPVGWLAAAAAVIVATVTWQHNAGLRQQLAGWQARTEQAQQQLAGSQTRAEQAQQQLLKARELLAVLTAPEARHVTLVAADEKPRPEGKAIWLEQGGKLIFLASNLPPLPAGRAYELWVIPPDGVPLPAGVFTPDEQGNAVVVNPPLPPGTQAKVFAVTVEPAGGSAAPTTKPMLAGAAA